MLPYHYVHRYDLFCSLFVLYRWHIKYCMFQERGKTSFVRKFRGIKLNIIIRNMNKEMY